VRFAARGQAGIVRTKVLMGIVPGGGATAYLPRLIGRARALEAIAGANLFDADLAERYGWIARCPPTRYPVLWLLTSLEIRPIQVRA
jgi:enoyl-CoA hydratase/carnithine racemase